ncbi:MAG TPA: UDP-3-O-(3-hydroxymyristoyl)glucosamine N-acyltransferase [Bryobacteraceae bacterium]|jgi:UDP-3-O-[3-hydroxymyristoyl] glucosamine N-acyltransferase|nr:UDP-3-O-(3-hydroxymyristoyl)glucosamine N-acyltransferase [Bryobacteraceae bacterium]
MPTLTNGEIATICSASIEGDPHVPITGANALESATASDLSFVANEKAVVLALKSKAGCLIVPIEFASAGPWGLIRVADPRAAFVHVLASLYPANQPIPGIHPSSVIAPSTRINHGCSIGPHVVIGENCSIGEGTRIYANCSIGSGVAVGANCTIYPNVTIYDGSSIGNRVRLHAGCVIGADGFGYTLTAGRYEKFPQVGTVEIGDDAEIGANSCIDRAALGVTRIGQGTKLDNLVHIAHNCIIGDHVVIAAQAGLSGGVVIGDYAFIGGQTGMGDKAQIEAKAIVAAKSGILTKAKVRAGEPVWGIPARPLRQYLKNLALVAKLSAMNDELRELKRKIAALQPLK